MKKIVINILLLFAVAVMFYGCSGTHSPDEVKTKLMDKYFSSDYYDTVRFSVQPKTSNTFELAVQQSLVDKNFIGTTKYLDTSVLFVIVLQDKSMQKVTSRESVVSAMTNLIQSVSLTDYALYMFHPKEDADATVYILLLKTLHNGEETDMSLMFLMRNEIIIAIKLY